MSITIRSSLAPNAPLIVLQTFEEFFNPTKHSLWQQSRAVTAAEWRDIYKTLFSRENCTNWNDLIIPYFNIAGIRVAPEMERFWKEVISLIRDEYLWQLPFHTMRRASDTLYRFYTLQFLDSSSNIHFSLVNDNRETNVSTPEEAARKFNENAVHLETLVNNHAHKLISDIQFGFYNCTSTINSMLSNSFYCRESNDISGSRGRAFTASTLFALMQNNRNVSLNCTASSIISVTIPFNPHDRSHFYQVFQYTTDITRILPGKRKLPSEGVPTYVGVELELSTDYNIQELIDASKELFFIAKHDSSITGRKSNKMELVTVPASFKYLKKQFALWFNNLDYKKFDCTTETNNGMHVHVDRQAFDDDYHIRNFCWFINNPANIPFIVAMSDRGSLAAMQHYTPFCPFGSHLSRTAAFKQSHRLIEGHRGATNLKGGWTNAKTVEVRIFRGIVSYAAIIKNLELVESILNFTKSLTSYRQLSLSSYIEWLFKTPSNRFSILKKYIEQQDLNKFLLVSDIKDIIFNENDPEKIATMLVRSGLKINNDHISFLNKGRKRTFTLDKDTGQINVIKTNIFKLADLDIDLAKRIARGSTQAA